MPASLGWLGFIESTLLEGQAASPDPVVMFVVFLRCVLRSLLVIVTHCM
jgi:hypothetical protein